MERATEREEETGTCVDALAASGFVCGGVEADSPILSSASAKTAQADK